MYKAGTLIGVVVALTVALIPAQAGAAPTDDTIVTFGVAAGSLDILTPAGPSNLGSGVPGSTLTGPIGPVAVTDTRGAADGSWAAEATSPDSTTAGALTIPATAIRYWSGPATATAGTGTFTPGQNDANDAEPFAVTPLVAFTHIGGTGGNSATWNPTLVINIPIDSQAGTTRRR